MSRPIVLYFPRGEGHVLPLGLVQVGSMAPEDRVVIVDGRVELAPEARVVDLADEALCLGVSVPTGAPIGDALRVSRAAKARNASLPVVWGGWHSSLAPELCLASGVVDACVVGQGERTFASVIDAQRQGRSFDAIPGIVWRREGEVVRNPPRPLEDMNAFPAADFGLLDMERYFRFRGARRLDYCSSQGWPSECAPGVLPRVGEQNWSGLQASRVAAEVKDHAGRYRLHEVFFGDGNFFADLDRAEAISRGLIELGVRVRWSGTGRADLLCRLSEEQLRLMRASGCARVNVGAERGGPAYEGILETAEKLHRAGIGARFSFLAGSPEEPREGLAQTYRTAKAVREIDGEFETPIHFCALYPGTALAERLPALGLALPSTLEEWAKLDPDRAIGPWISEPARRSVPRYNFYLRHGYQKPGRRLGKRLLHHVARARARTNFYAFDFERRAVDLSKRLRGRLSRPPPTAAED